ncbi:MAG: putative toxin-antitoxin system toxin component, PIN family [Bacteroidales bacterium]|jgi:putative PIN family toxin of toxin-antitoxin system|uniref:putative toxin-antitoxin system toxin component, PIN family n=1 Tax=uncultured Fibrobacter sp. TaxID=261512 RepID=UPI0015645A1B|nr:putative toxin-antitoxin system toxin component, PIN family [uncultured Fibrobacter sp.]MEE3485928.1 putative toxin-antitoxin system toxin component, PIN family [Bacteroidales bacterium]
MRIVLDTNCLLASLSRRGAYFNVWKGLQEGKYTLCVSNEILEEYEEIIAQKTNSVIASNVVQTLLNAPSVELIDAFFRFDLIKNDPDDNKFVDCAIAGNATFVVSNDSHFDVLKEIDFPKLILKSLQEFSAMLD